MLMTRLLRLATTPGQCDAGSIGQVLATTWSAPFARQRYTHAHSELMMASSLIRSSNAPIDVGMQPSKKLDNRNEPVTWLHLLLSSRRDSNAGIISIRAHKVQTDVGIIADQRRTRCRHGVTPSGTAGFQYIQRAHASGKETQI